MRSFTAIAGRVADTVGALEAPRPVRQQPVVPSRPPSGGGHRYRHRRWNRAVQSHQNRTGRRRSGNRPGRGCDPRRTGSCRPGSRPGIPRRVRAPPAGCGRPGQRQVHPVAGHADLFGALQRSPQCRNTAPCTGGSGSRSSTQSSSGGTCQPLGLDQRDEHLARPPVRLAEGRTRRSAADPATAPASLAHLLGCSSRSPRDQRSRAV
jgi:hypothetical protein